MLAAYTRTQTKHSVSVLDIFSSTEPMRHVYKCWVIKRSQIQMSSVFQLLKVKQVAIYCCNGILLALEEANKEWTNTPMCTNIIRTMWLLWWVIRNKHSFPKDQYFWTVYLKHDWIYFRERTRDSFCLPRDLAESDTLTSCLFPKTVRHMGLNVLWYEGPRT